MNAQGAIRNTLNMSTMVLNNYLNDLSDADLLQKPGEGCNPIAWQLGHLITSECGLLNGIKPGAAPELPEGFAESHGREQAGDGDPGRFSTRQEYLDLFEQVHAASLGVLEEMSEADLDRPSPERFRDRFPTVGDIFVLIAVHGMMHAGQLVPVRRALDKPVVI